MSTREAVRIKTQRGILTVGPHGQLEGFWRIASREIRTAPQVRKMAGGVTRATLLRWRRTQGFPEPVLTLKDQNVPIPLWSRTEVETWLQARSGDQ